MSLTQAKERGYFGSNEDTYNNYLEAIADAFPEYCISSGDTVTPDTKKIGENFRVYFTKNDSSLLVPHFVSTTDLQSGMLDANGYKYVSTYDYLANGQYTSYVKKEQCKLTFDASGRITKIDLPIFRG